METLESLRDQIDTTTDLQSIVRTMKSLSAVSIRQYERAVTALRDYTRTIELGLQVVLREKPLLAAPAEAGGMTVAIVFGSDHGLCGRFNDQIADYARESLAETLAAGAPKRLLAVGLRAASRLEGRGETIDACFFLPGAVSGLTGTAQRALLQIEAWRAEYGTVRVHLFHNRRTEEAAAVPRGIRLLPLERDWLEGLQRRKWPGPTLPTFTMDADRLFSALIRQHLFVSIFRAGAESMASEHATRLAAMQVAERNIEDHLEEMNTEYRRRRQQSITEELLDVFAGFETLRTTS